MSADVSAGTHHTPREDVDDARGSVRTRDEIPQHAKADELSTPPAPLESDATTVRKRGSARKRLAGKGITRLTRLWSGSGTSNARAPSGVGYPPRGVGHWVRQAGAAGSARRRRGHPPRVTRSRSVQRQPPRSDCRTHPQAPPPHRATRGRAPPSARRGESGRPGRKSRVAQTSASMRTQVAQVTSARLVLVVQVPKASRCRRSFSARSRAIRICSHWRRTLSSPSGRRSSSMGLLALRWFHSRTSQTCCATRKSNKHKSMPSQIRSKMSSNSGVSAVVPCLWIAR